MAKYVAGSSRMQLMGSNLSSRRDGNDKRGDGRAAQIDQPAFRQQDHPLAVRPNDVIHLRANLFPRQIRRPQTVLLSTN